MDIVLERLRRRGSARNNKSTVILTPTISKTDSGYEGLGLREILLMDNFLGNLDPEKVREYLKNPNPETVKKLLMADSYVAKHGDTGIYTFLEDQTIGLNAWTAYVTTSLRVEVVSFTRSLYRRQPQAERKPLDSILEQTIQQILDFDLAAYQRMLVRNEEYNLLVLCNNLLTLPLGEANLKDVPKSVRERVAAVSSLLSTYKMDIAKDGYNALHILESVPELKYRYYHGT